MFTLDKGEIEKALFTLAVPEKWNGNLLLFAHGCRPVGIPLQADLEVEDLFYKSLINQGWIVGMTSYRREGVIVRDAIEDVENVRLYVCGKYGEPKSTFLEGASMGGCIVTLLAENQGSFETTGKYHGAILNCAALLARDPVDPLYFTHKPVIPMIYLTNADEAPQIANYVEQCETVEGAKLPAAWYINRNGHCNLNWKEREQAFCELLAWTQNPTYPMAMLKDATITIDPEISAVTWNSEGGLGKIVATDAWGDLYTNILPRDLQKIGIVHGMSFYVQLGGSYFSDGNFSVKVKYGGNSFISVRQGDWYCFDSADGYLVISANGYSVKSCANEIAGVTVGDEVKFLRPVGVGAALTGIPGQINISCLAFRDRLLCN